MPTAIDGRRARLREIAPAASTNVGLWLDKHLNRSVDDGAVRELVVGLRSAVRPPEGYKDAFARRAMALELLDGGFDDGVTRFWKGVVQGRMIVGIGLASSRETGISLLHTWGVPFIPGSALKGVAASMAREHAGDTWKPGGDGHRALFGDHTLGGAVVFHDAWWVPGTPDEHLPLDLDVMTVHHREYYGGSGQSDEAPCDWDEPNPVAFITACGEYRIALSGPANWVDAAGELLALGLAGLGVGAKTAAGYGRVELTRILSEADRQRALAVQEQAREVEALKGIARRFKDASNANDLVKELLRARLQGSAATAVRAAADELWRRNPKFWKEWLKKPSRSVEEIEIMRPQ